MADTFSFSKTKTMAQKVDYELTEQYFVCTHPICIIGL